MEVTTGDDDQIIVGSEVGGAIFEGIEPPHLAGIRIATGVGKLLAIVHDHHLNADEGGDPHVAKATYPAPAR